MRAFTTHTGLVATMDRHNVDTDQIIPKQFLKRIERTGFGKFLFNDWRFDAQGQPLPDFELNQTRFQGASILVARQNFGCGSSREHAVWALDDFGFRSVIAESFADIFHNNCFKNGVLPITLANREIDEIFQSVDSTEGFQLTIDLSEQKVRGDGIEFAFQIDPFRRECLLEGLDDIDLTLQHEDKISDYESKMGIGI